MSNASALFRSLLVYGLCLPLAVLLGYLLASPQDFSTLTVVTVIFCVLAIPLLLRWHHIWLIASWNTGAMLFFLPGKPPLWMGLAAASFLIAILQYTLNRRMKFLSAPSVVRPLIFLIAVVLITARLNGGLGMKMLGGDTYGGKKYMEMLAAVMGYFAIINRRIPPKQAGLYIALFFLGSATTIISDLPGRMGSSMNFLFVLFPVSSLAPFTDQNSVVGQTQNFGRVTGLSSLGLTGFCLMLARYGIRGVLDTSKPWRLGLFLFSVVLSLYSGFRGTLITIVLVGGLLFYLERLHQTRLLLPVIFVSLAAGGLTLLFSARLPLSVQRSLTVVPFLQLDPLVRLDAEGSSDWRKQMWEEVAPQVSQYFLVGKGFTFSNTELQQIGWRGLGSAELVGNYHNGPLDIMLAFGIFGTIAFVWLLLAGLRVVYDNYQFGDPAYHHINIFLFAYFVEKVIFFFTIFGSVHSDLQQFLGVLALSISLNGGVAKPAFVPQPKVVFNRFKLHPSVRRPISV